MVLAHLAKSSRLSLSLLKVPCNHLSLSVYTGRKCPKAMPVFDSDSWWKFVKCLLRRVLGFGLRVNRKDNDPQKYSLVANSFWEKHKVDVMAVVKQHREQTRGVRNDRRRTTTHNGRPFGQYQARMRRCDMCPPGSSAVYCVRQFGSQWLCMKPGSGTLTQCHPDFHTPIDVGYLDLDLPSSPETQMNIEEILATRSAPLLLYHSA